MMGAGLRNSIIIFISLSRNSRDATSSRSSLCGAVASSGSDACHTAATTSTSLSTSSLGMWKVPGDVILKLIACLDYSPLTHWLAY